MMTDFWGWVAAAAKARRERRVRKRVRRKCIVVAWPSVWRWSEVVFSRLAE
jgi:hypothetical protein